MVSLLEIILLNLLFFLKDKKKEPPYGAEVLRLWVGTIDYWRDVAMGRTALAHVAESLRKIRNSARFALGNVGDGKALNVVAMKKDDLSLVSRLYHCYSAFLTQCRWNDI